MSLADYRAVVQPLMTGFGILVLLVAFGPHIWAAFINWRRR